MKIIPFHQHDFSEVEIKGVVKVLKQKWITGGPENISLEKELKKFLGASDVVSLNSATSGLFLSLKMFGVKPGDEVITSPYSFVATANVICQCGARPVFADIGLDYNIDPQAVEAMITPRTKAIIAVDYGGYPCNYAKLKKIAARSATRSFQTQNFFQETLGRPLIIADSAHSIGTLPHHSRKPYSKYKNFFADIHCYSFHAVKNITCGEGGAVSVMNESLFHEGYCTKLRQARLHGINKDAYHREQQDFFYDMEEVGYKCNLSEIQAAIARIQLKRISLFLKKKKILKKYYDGHFQKVEEVKLRSVNGIEKLWQVHPHIYTLECESLSSTSSRDWRARMKTKGKFFRAALKKGLSLNFHYLPIPLMSYYRNKKYSLAHIPRTNYLYPRHISIPFHTKLTLTDAKKVVTIIKELVKK